MVDFGNTLKALRTENNFTQAKLAQKLGLTKSIISAYENGIRMPSYDVLISIAKIFNVTTDYLLGVDSSHKVNIDFSGLSESEMHAILKLINAMKNDN